MKPSDPVRELWRVMIAEIPRASGIKPSEPSAWHIGTLKHCTPREIVKLARLRFTAAWWDEHTIISVEQIGKLHILDGVNLYEED